MNFRERIAITHQNILAKRESMVSSEPIISEEITSPDNTDFAQILAFETEEIKTEKREETKSARKTKLKGAEPIEINTVAGMDGSLVE